VLGIERTSTTAEIRSAYRKLVLLHHPDRSNDLKSKALFLEATAAYDVIGDPAKRREYDSRLAIEGRMPHKSSGGSRPYSTPSARAAEIRLDINRLNALYSRGNYAEAENVARSVIERDRRQSVAYAILGNIARIKGNRAEAIKMYGYALQFDPKNPVYQARYDELVDLKVPVAKQTAGKVAVRTASHKSNQVTGPFFGIGIILLACVYLVYAHEDPMLPDIGFISTWTIGLVAMLFFSGVVLGACLSLDGLLGTYLRTSKTAFGRIPPAVALATIALANFWAAVLMYILIGLKWRAFSLSTSRLIACVVAGTCILAIAAEASERISGIQVIAWGGNLMYIGALSGWMVTDALRGGNG